MERAPRTRPRPHALILALLAALTLMLSAATGPVVAKPAKTPPGLANKAESGTATVMTRNLYLGAELGTILDAFPQGGQAVVVAASQTWAQARASQPAARMAAIADEIVAAGPDAVGLQEVTRYTTVRFPGQTGSGPESEVVEYDLLDLLLDALADRGVTYREVPGATANNFTTPQPIPVVDPVYPVTAVGGIPQPNRAVTLLDRDVIIVRDDVTATNARTGQFDAIITSPLPIKRGWGSADLTVGEARFRFVNSHTEAFGGEAIRIAEVQQLLAAQAAIAQQSGFLPSVYAGDYNSAAPSGGAYQALLAGGLRDLWVLARSGAPKPWAQTCCQAADLRNQVSDLNTRIDLLLASRGVKAISADRVGDDPVPSLPEGVRWASDHAGVVADVLVKPVR